VLTALLWVWLSGGFNEIIPTTKNKMIMARAALEGGIAFTFITALALISLPDITAQPLWKFIKKRA
jgi:hypothetical protein